MELDALKEELQNFFTDGLLTIIGSGLSCAEGLPGMKSLGSHLQNTIPKKVTEKLLTEWNSISKLIEDGKDIESAMIECSPSQDLENHISEGTANYLGEAELKIAQNVLLGSNTLRFSRLLDHMLKPNTGIPVITTNYDRLIEIASEAAGLGVDTMFVGHHIGSLNEKECRLSFCRDAAMRKRSRVQFTYAKRVLLLKPHGSLDWFLMNDEPVRCPLPLALPRLIITPGLHKFRSGYDRPFDRHRERANSEIDKASRYLIIGYGFNDDHLETHLSPHLRNGRPGLILTHSLSNNAKKIIDDCRSIIAITAHEDPKQDGAKVYHSGKDYFFPGPNLWDVGIFIEEVLEP